MKRAKATSRCEVGGKVYLPGDDMTVTDEQYAYLEKHKAATEITMHAVGPQMTPGDTMTEVDAKFAKKLGTLAKTNGVGKP